MSSPFWMRNRSNIRKSSQRAACPWRPTLETLEDRLLPSLTPHLLKDINTHFIDANPSAALDVGGVGYFVATNGPVRGLWRSDGTAAGTFLVKDVSPDSNPGNLINVNGTLFFSTNNGPHDSQLWRSNGTAAGTQILMGFNSGVLSAEYPGYLTNVSGTLFFSGFDASHGRELWRSDGSAAGTHIVADINPGPGTSYPNQLTNVNGTLFFSDYDGTHGYELWRSDGTAAGTQLVQDINPGSNGSGPNNLTNMGGTLFFQADDGQIGAQLWRSNGTAAGTVLVKDISLGLGGSSSNPHYLTNVNGTLFFQADDDVHGFELWRSDGTAAGTQIVSSLIPRYLTNVSGTLCFQANDGTHGLEVWRSNGTAAGTQSIADINHDVTLAYSAYLTNVNGTLFFRATDATHGTELWRSNGTAAGTQIVADIHPNIPYGTRGSYPNNLSNVGGTLFFAANDGTNGVELWRSNGTAGGTRQIAQINVGTLNSNPAGFFPINGTVFFSASDGNIGNAPELWDTDGTAAGTQLLTSNAVYPKYLTNMSGTLFFQASDGTHGAELWRSDGTPAGTQIVKDINPGGFGSNPVSLINAAGTLLFWANDGTHGTELWRSNGTAAGTQMISSSLLGPSYLTNVGGTLFFPVSDGTHGDELWRTDGTAAGTQMVADINPGSGSSYPSNLINVGGTLFFSANDGTHGTELWRSNGVTSGTVLVKDISPGSHLAGPTGHQYLVPNSSYPGNLMNFAGTLFFSANDGTHGVELWRSNGTAAGTQMVDDINPGSVSSYPTNLMNVGGTLFFLANDGTHGVELWRSDGTAGGTQMVDDSTSNPNSFTTAGGTLFFDANDGTHGLELWRSNGTAAGTQIVKDINPGSSGSYPFSLTNVRGVLYFGAIDGTHGAELWRSDGTAGGTQLVADIFPGSSGSIGTGGSDPGYLTNADGTLFFAANDRTHGVEPWVLTQPLADSTTAVTSSPNPSLAGQAVFFTATVRVAGVVGTPTGSVDFKENATDLAPGGITLDGSGVATFSISSLLVGSHTITATYGGDNDFLPSSGGDSAAPQTVNKDSTSTSVTITPISGATHFGDTITLTANVTTAGPLAIGAATGSVDFVDSVQGDLTPGGIALKAGTASVATASLSAGTHTITATYSGDGNFATSKGGATRSVKKAMTQTVVNLSSAASVYAQGFLATATVSAISGQGAGSPTTGKVAFTDVLTTNTGIVTLAAAAAPHARSLSVKPLAGSLTAGSAITFSGHTVTLSANAAAGATTLSVDNIGASGIPSGATSNTMFLLGAQTTTTVGLVSVNASGKAVFSVTLAGGRILPGVITVFQTNGQRANLTPVNHVIKGQYLNDLASAPSDPNFAPSGISAGKAETISRDVTMTQLGVAPNPARSGQTVTLTATVRSTGGSLIGPIGTVTFKDSYTIGGVTTNTTLGTVTLPSLAPGVVAARATFTTNSLVQATHTLSVVYNGDEAAPFPLSTSYPFRAQWLISNQTGVVLVVNAVTSPDTAFSNRGVVITGVAPDVDAASGPSQPTVAMSGNAQNLVTTGFSNDGAGYGSLVELQHADQRLGRGEATAGGNKLQAFVRQVDDFFSTDILTSANGKLLIDVADPVIAPIQQKK
jgi:ELWxxDGT repeat protein